MNKVGSISKKQKRNVLCCIVNLFNSPQVKIWFSLHQPDVGKGQEFVGKGRDYVIWGSIVLETRHAHQPLATMNSKRKQDKIVFWEK